MEKQPMKVLEAISAVQAALVFSGGISKDRKNQAQGYSFRGIDDMYNTLAPVLAKAKLVVLPSFSDRHVVERANKNGTALFYVTLRADFTFRSAEDGSEVKVTTYGEAMDSGDKATNKAMSAAFKYALMQTFTIPTEGDNDSENYTHEVRPEPQGLSSEELASVSVKLEEAARRGTKALQEAWGAIPTPAKVALRELKESLKHRAADFDLQRAA